MLYVGYVTPYRVTLLVLLYLFCHDAYTTELAPNMVVFLTKSILDETLCRETCSEPTLQQVLSEIKQFKVDPRLIQITLDQIENQLKHMISPHGFQEFMKSLKGILDQQLEEDEEGNEIARPEEGVTLLDKCSVFGLFVRQCRVEYESMPFSQLHDIQKGFKQYMMGLSGDSEFTTGVHPEAEGWISDYNITEFLKYQAERIEKTGTSNIDSTQLHHWLQKMERNVPTLLNISQVRYLNYMRTKEYINALSHLHLSFDLSLVKGVDMQYALLNLGILEYKFGHRFNAFSAFNDAISAARANQDDYCLQEILYWTELCKSDSTLDQNISYTDKHLSNMKTLAHARNMLQDGTSCRYVFEALYKSQLSSILNGIQLMDRVQYLMTSLAWLRYGNSVLGESYLKLAKSANQSSVDDIEKTVITEARLLQSSGKTDKAIQVLTEFTNKFQNESDLLIEWRQAKASILNQSRKRSLSSMNQQEAIQLTLTNDIEEYFLAIQDRSYRLILEKEFDKTILVFDGMQNYIQKTNQTHQLANMLILQAVYYMHTNNPTMATFILTKAMKSAQECHDAKNYYCATIKLSEAYVRLNQRDLLEKAVYMLETIFPQVLLIKNVLLNSDLYLTYAQALNATSMTTPDPVILEYAEKAAQGYQVLSLKYQLLKALQFQVTIANKLSLRQKEHEIHRLVRNLQRSL